MKLFNTLIISTFLIIGTTSFHAQTIRYVKTVASGNGSGSSWANASDDLQTMIDASISNDIVRVAAGTYKPFRRADDLTVINPNDRDNAFVLKNEVLVYGGYDASGNGIRDIVANPTILSGDIGVLNDNSDNCYHVVLRTGLPGNEGLDGFTISDGNANGTTQITVNGEAFHRGKGGGVYTITSFQNAGNNKVFDIINCTFINNNAISGGGIYSGGFFRSNTSILDCSFIDNTATNGGGIYNGGYESSGLKVNRCKFMSNTATTNGGAINNGDNNIKGIISITNSSFIDNDALNGGGIYNHDFNSTSSSVKNCNFVENTAVEGSGIYNTANNSTYVLNIINCIIWNNNGTNSDLANTIGNIDVSYSVVENGYVGLENISLDPLFTDAPNGDYSLQINSPAINMGDYITYPNGNLDLAGNNRRIGLYLDAGAYESPYGEITPDSAGIVYVDKNVVSRNRNGNSWLIATPELADALIAAKTNPNITQIWVAQGTYSPLYSPETSSFGFNGNRDNTFLIVNNVKIYGGFQNANETNINQRDTINLNTILAAAGTPLSKSYHVVVSAGPVGTATIDGFTIRDGDGNYYSSSGSNSININGIFVNRNFGGGISMNETNLEIKNCAITNNFARYGGGISIKESTSSINNCRISDNDANEGGGIHLTLFDTLFINNSQINDNSASKGAGIYSFLSSYVIEKCTLNNNSASQEGGGIHNHNSNTVLPYPKIHISNSVITKNTAPDGSGAYLDTRSDLTLINSTLAGNDGIGTIFCKTNTYSSVGFYNSILWDNTSGFELGTGSNTYSSFNSLIEGKNDFPTNGNLDGTNIANDPLFTDTLNGDFTLKPCSPAVNSGSNSEYTLNGGNLAMDNDLAENPRLFEGTIDMGAYELQTPFTSQVIPTFTQLSPVCFGDTFQLPTVSDNGISGTWSPTPDNTQTTVYTFTPTPGACISTNGVDMTVSITPLDDATFAYPTSSICTEAIFISPSNITTQGGTFTAQAGLVLDSATGEIDVAASQTGTYTITYTTSQQCPNQSTESFTINNLPDASFSYSNANYCTTSANPNPIVTGSFGTFSATPSGLSINPTTGEINLSASLPGVYNVTNEISATGNCPASIKTETINIEEAPTATITLSAGVLTANDVAGATYQWINCTNQAQIQGETGQTFTPSVGGLYAVIITNGNCSTTSACEQVSPLSIQTLSAEKIKIYPNPAANFIYISSPVPVDVSVSTIDGKIVQSIENAEKIDLTSLANSIYLVRITNKEGAILKVERIVINH